MTHQHEVVDGRTLRQHGPEVAVQIGEVALADAAARWGRLYRQGIPYITLQHNNINHPDKRGMAIFADALMALFVDTPAEPEK